jgi:glycosyltransferase involved in cell wall biosynthesis
MRIAYITAGAGGTICGNCLRDNALVAALRQAGHDALLLPVYTPTKTDETNLSQHKVYLGGLNLYLEMKYAWARHLPRFLMHWLDSPALLSQVSKFAVKTLPEDLGQLTLATLEAEEGPVASGVSDFIDSLKTLNPDVVHFTNTMLAGLAPMIRRELGVPVVSSLQGEDYFLSNLPAPYSEQSFATLRRMADSIDAFAAPCRDHAETMAPHIGRPAEEIAIVPPGITVEDFSPRRDRNPKEFVVGYLARIATEKGLHLLLGAIRHMRDHETVDTPKVKLRIAGWVSADYESYVTELQSHIAEWGLSDRVDFQRYIERDEKIDFLRSLDAFSVPVTYGAAKGLYVLEAWACGVPVVQPMIGVFPELLAETAGGLLCAPRSFLSLKTKLEYLRDNPAEAAAMGERGRQGTLEKFTAQKMAAATLALYERLT